MGLLDFLSSDERLFRKAYWGVMEEIEAPRSAKKTLLPYLEKAFFAGVADNGLNHVKRELPDGTWQWAEYSRQAADLEYDKHKTLVNRIWRLAYAASQHRRILHSRDSFPYLMLSVPQPNKARPECVARDGKLLHLDHDYWRDGLPPCDRLDCLCRVIPMNDGMIRRRGLTVDKT